MSDAWTQQWNDRFSKPGFAYGELPNEYLKAQLDQLAPGKILFPAEGEGRNAVYAAGKGWTVSAFDISIEGRKKALQLASRNGVSLDYLVEDIRQLPYAAEQFDAMALIYAHFPAPVKSAYHKILHTYLRKGGTLIFEAFSKSHLQYNSNNEKVGGPRDIGMLFSTEELKSDFPHYEILELTEAVVDLNEGPHHSGRGSVIRFTGRKLL